MKKPTERIIGYDIARSLAILGMVIVNYKISMNAEGNGPEWLIYWTSLLEGRASAIFVILAGVGISLMTQRVRLSENNSQKYRLTIWKRSLFLFVLGMSLYLMQWSADILHYYAFYMVIASFFIKASSKKIIITALSIVFTAQLLQLLLDYEYGWNATFSQYEMFWTFKGFFSNLFFNGYHPIFPWVAFLLIGMWLGRLDFQNHQLQKKGLIVSFIIFIVVEAASFIFIKLSTPSVGMEIAYYLFDTKPMPPTMLYIISSSCTSIIVIILCIQLSEKFKKTVIVQSLVYTGQLALTLYVGHFLALVFLFVFSGLTNYTLKFAIVFSFVFFLLSIISSVWWRKRFKRGPIEFLMRKVSE
ncbi:heparan-alpha-glucosaminide N-acetyltransferase domain-containing protein [Bacillus carboniphilus]|uniref:Heparan-alpha-glucosaminide N-acetyltransferase domain-containing protein n=1 Tax=Bacillus carboniphilus TaxID=86663 RepID=A0ABY9JRH3_9BACI|nr:heparan-alpha-glucosaminide N-acetyltransferase domain-containing protein [Bacillus carboniphilus]WLR41414.1 heparan-alpha-glucosaminide N-acetyltransferase domain-containing protein [Bacillus carboniphilus]